MGELSKLIPKDNPQHGARAKPHSRHFKPSNRRRLPGVRMGNASATRLKIIQLQEDLKNIPPITGLNCPNLAERQRITRQIQELSKLIPKDNPQHGARAKPHSRHFKPSNRRRLPGVRMGNAPATRLKIIQLQEDLKNIPPITGLNCPNLAERQ